MNKSEELISKIDNVLNQISERATSGRFHIHITSTNKYGLDHNIMHAHVASGEQIHSVLHRAASHMRDGGMPNIKAKVRDTKTNKVYHHTINSPDGGMKFDGPDPHSYAH